MKELYKHEHISPYFSVNENASLGRHDTYIEGQISNVTTEGRQNRFLTIYSNEIDATTRTAYVYRNEASWLAHC